MKWQRSGLVSSLAVVVLLVVLTAPLIPATAQSQVGDGLAASSGGGQALVAPRRTSLMFIENVGQFDERARFQVHTSQGAIWLAQDALWLTLLEQTDGSATGQAEQRSPSAQPTPAALQPNESAPGPNRGANLKLTFVGGNPAPRLEPFDRLATHVSYFIGNDPSRWHAEVPVWGGVRYRGLFPGVDLEMNAENGQWIWRLIAYDGATLDKVRLRVEGADALHVDKDGRLIADTAGGPVTLPLLQASSGTPMVPIANLDTLTFAIPEEVRSPASLSSFGFRAQAPNDDPSQLLYSTFLGGSGAENTFGLAVDSEGAAYVSGQTYSSDFPVTPGAFDTERSGSSDVFVAKIHPTGSELVYATYIGGASDEWAADLALDESGAATITGSTLSSSFPTTAGAFDTTHNGSWDAYVTKLNAEGSDLVFGTFLGGNDNDYGESIALDATATPYVVGETWSAAFPTTPGAYDTTNNGLGDAFVTKFDPSGSDLIYSTFVGGSNYDCWNCALAVDGEGAAYITGYTKSSDFPATPGAFDTTYNGGWDGYAAKLNAIGNELEYATFLGGSSDDCYEDCKISVDAGGAAYVVGNTWSSNFPTTPGAYDTTYNGNRDGFVLKLTASGDDLAYSTFLGGSQSDLGHSLTADSTGAAVVVGKTASANFPTTADAYDTSHNGATDVFLARLNAAGSTLEYATFLGGSGDDCGYWCVLALSEASETAYVAGSTSSSNFPATAGAFDTSYNGAGDAFVSALAPVAPDFYLRHDPDVLDVCAPADATYEIRVGSEGGYADPVSLEALGVPPGASFSFDPNPVTPPALSAFTVSDTGAAAPGSYDIDVVGLGSSSTHTTTMTLNLYSWRPARPRLLEPPDGALDQPLQPTFTWRAAFQAGSYAIQVALDPGFAQIVEQASGIPGTTYTLVGVLEPDTLYYWRVRGENACAVGRYSLVFSFRTGVGVEMDG